jgi:hypothetical protein
MEQAAKIINIKVCQAENYMNNNNNNNNNNNKLLGTRSTIKRQE